MIHVEKHGPVIAIRMARGFLGRPIYWTAAYWVDGLLIDTGPACTASELTRLLRPVPVDTIVLTHSHEDHIGGLAAVLEQRPDAKVYASPRALPTVAEPARLRMQLYRRLVWGSPAPMDSAISTDEVENRIETPGYSFRVVETPGHTRDHICLFEPEQRWLFSGDAYIGGEDQAWAPEFDMFGIISSLRTLATLHPERLFPGSGSVRRTPLPDIHQKIRQLTELARNVAQLDRVGLTVPEMVAYLFNEEPRLHFWTRGHFSAVHLVEACRAYNAIFLAPDETSMRPPTRSPDVTDSPSTSASRKNSPDSSTKNKRDR